MNGFLDHLIFHIASGQAFFLGSGLILLGLALSAAVKSKAVHRMFCSFFVCFVVNNPL